MDGPEGPERVWGRLAEGASEMSDMRTVASGLRLERVVPTWSSAGPGVIEASVAEPYRGPVR
jgi:hypothetical protein